MKKRQIIIVAIAIGIFVIGKLVSNALAEAPDRPAAKPKDNTTTVFTETVLNAELPVFVEATGLLEAVERLELFSEVQGVMLSDGGRFKAGTSFRKGEVLVAVRADDKYAQLVAQRSGFERLVSSVMADLRIDFKDEYMAWQNYLDAMDVETLTAELPEVRSEKLKRFLTGRNIYSEFYALRNTQIGLSKYRITAPYEGVLTQANADPGTVIRQGQQLGVFIKPGNYELKASVDAVTIERLKEGQEVELKLDGLSEKSWTGNISRINRAIDPNSQLSEFFVNIKSDDLKDGMFMQAIVQARSVPDAFQLPRSVLIDRDHVFLVEDSALVLHRIEPAHFNERSVMVRGLKNGAEVLTKVPPGAYAGMKVSIYKAQPK